MRSHNEGVDAAESGSFVVRKGNGEFRGADIFDILQQAVFPRLGAVSASRNTYQRRVVHLNASSN